MNDILGVKVRNMARLKRISICISEKREGGEREYKARIQREKTLGNRDKEDRKEMVSGRGASQMDVYFIIN